MRKVNIHVLIFLFVLMAMLAAFTSASAAANEPHLFIEDKITYQSIFSNDKPADASEMSALQAAASADGESSESAAPVFKLPASLLVIEDEAFEGTALVTVDIPETVEEVGEKAFANIPTLRFVKLPEDPIAIAGDAFAGSNNVTITGAPGGYARRYAKENGIPFAPMTVMVANSHTTQIFTASVHRAEALSAEDGVSQAVPKPAVRTVGEIQTERYEEGIAIHIQGRSPPAYL